MSVHHYGEVGLNLTKTPIIFTHI